MDILDTLKVPRGGPVWNWLSYGASPRPVTAALDNARELQRRRLRAEVYSIAVHSSAYRQPTDADTDTPGPPMMLTASAGIKGHEKDRNLTPEQHCENVLSARVRHYLRAQAFANITFTEQNHWDLILVSNKVRKDRMRRDLRRDVYDT